MRRARVRPKRRGGGFKKFLFFIFLLAIIAGAGFIFASKQFEKIPPKIVVSNQIYTNLKTPIKIGLEDNVAVKSVDIYVVNSKGEKIALLSETFPLLKQKNVVNVVIPPKFKDAKKLIIEARDNSKWNFLQGNKSVKEVNLIVDNTPPQISLLSFSQYIRKGGSGLVVFKVSDYGLKNLYIDAQNGNKFKVIKYRKNGVFASLIAWKFNKDTFNPVIVAVDLAGNIGKYTIPFRKINKKYRVSKIRVTDRFINGKISDLVSMDPDYSNITDPLKKFKAVNELMRKKNEDYIHKMSSKVTPIQGKWNIKPFYPLKNAKRVANFGDHRYYYYKDPNKIISESYHLGLDLASVRHDNIYASNDGIVVSTKLNGIYGNMPLIDHGMGLYTLYGHCSKILVKVGDRVHSGEVIAKTGMTGLALGDHLHFGVLVQGIEVNPYEWMDKKWIKEHIIDIFSKADKILGYN